MPPSAATAYQALSSYQVPDAQSVINNADTQAGVGAAQSRVSDLRSAVNNLNTSLNAVDPSVTGRTSGTFTTEGQRSALVSKEQAPIQTNLTARNQDLNTATGDFNTAEGRASTLASAIMSQNKDTYQKLLDQYNASAAYEKEQQDRAQAAAQFAATQQLEQSKLSEQQREFNNPHPTAATAADLQFQQTQATQQAVQKATQTIGPALAKVTGRDGYVSPNDYNAAKREWSAAGLSTATFDQVFAGYRNPGNTHYGVSTPNLTAVLAGQ